MVGEELSRVTSFIDFCCVRVRGDDVGNLECGNWKLKLMGSCVLEKGIMSMFEIIEEEEEAAMFPMTPHK